MRHGETQYNRERRFQGWSADSHLTEAGKEEARVVASLLLRSAAKISALYSSDLERALETAHPISRVLGLPILSDPCFREMNFGAWEGLLREEAARIDPEAYRLWLRGSPDVKPRGGESFREMSDRVLFGLSVLAKRHQGQSIVIVTHLGPLRGIVCTARGWTYDRRHEISVPNCAVVVTEVSVTRDTSVFQKGLPEECPEAFARPSGGKFTLKIKEVGEMKAC
ncbi:MAG TPA: histidine phosphatase family protein [Clostridia bacterium]|nr:histidine phosphatase family protein [Clostridia bacterium]